MINIKKNLSQHVEEILRKKIMLLQFCEGEHLNETNLAKELNISRGPIREAIKKLELEGLVNTASNGRTLVSKFDIHYVKNLYEVRILLEKFAVQSLTPQLIQAEGKQLQFLMSEMKKTIHNNEMYRESDLNFHYHIVKMSKNQTLIQSWLALKDLIITLIDVTTEVTQSRNAEIIIEHEKIVNSILKGENELACQYLEQHLSGAADIYSEAVFKLQNEEEIEYVKKN